jgi:hypothetical protein
MKSMERAGVPEGERAAFYAEATASNYDHLLQTCMAWVDVS